MIMPKALFRKVILYTVGVPNTRCARAVDWNCACENSSQRWFNVKPAQWASLVICGLVGLVLFMLLGQRGLVAAEPATLIAPLFTPSTESLLSVPYYGAEWFTAYVDHDSLNSYLKNGRILIYDGRAASLANGWCDDPDNDPHIAFCTQLSPNPPNCNGSCLWYDAHQGTDFGLAYEPVLAPADGTVILAGWQDWNNRYAGYGLHLRILHEDGYETRYGHLSALVVLANATVSRGQIIGTSGNTGNSSGAHLHFEVLVDNAVTDPFGGTSAEWLWQDGSWDERGRWVGPPTPRYGTAVVADDDYPEGGQDDPNFLKGRTIEGQAVSCPPEDCPYWHRSTTVGHDGDMLYTFVNGDVTDYWVRWMPSRHGLFDVQVWIPNDNATSWWARYWLVSSYFYMPVTYMVVDQWGIPGQWISLGVYQFGSYPSAPWLGLWMSDATTEGGNAHGGQASLCPDILGGQYYCRLGVDAIRFRTPWPVYIPLALKNY